ncbi:MAG: ParA family protein [Actinomycetota bacterium]|jgi:cellulose biosynthesis protein BcsQ|nr:ParA family protein [Actinomycetota bacterium]MDD5601133.1 ParA family protein [Actinomycetota bacterium]
MKIILVVTVDRELIKAISAIKLQNYNTVILNNISFITHYLEEYIPDYIILSGEFERCKEVMDYLENNSACELFIMGQGDKKNNFSGNIYLDEVKNARGLERVLRIIDNMEKGEDISIKNKYKIIPQQVISFYSIQGGVGKTSIAFNFAWYIKDIIEGKILIIDLNFCEGPSDLTINLNLDLSPNLSVFIENITDSENCFNNSIINLDGIDKINILQPPISIYQSDRFNIDMLDSVIYSARNKYNIILADIPFRYDNISLEMLNLSTTSILVLSPDIKLFPRIGNFKKFLPEDQKKGIVFNKISIRNKAYIDECKNIYGIPVYDRISGIPEESMKKITNGVTSFDILNLQAEMPDLVNSIF